jgi:hypothetical protein
MIPFMRKGLLLTITVLALYACSDSGRSGHRTFYVSDGGDDQHSGKSSVEAWKTIDKINRMKFSPGDVILFNGGDEFTGTLTFSGEDSGTEGNEIRLSSFGDGKAVINGVNGEALNADSCHHLTIENLAFKGSGRLTGNVTDGLAIKNCNAVILDHLEVYGFQHSGVHLHKCNDARITYVYAHDNGFAGIHVTGSTMRDPDNYDNHHLYIGYCVAENNPGDPTVVENHSGNGILASSVKDGTIEYCEAFNNGWDMIWTGNGPVGIWIWDCTDFTIQYCIAHHNRTNPVAADGGGFDFDGGVSNSVIQYCIAHHNEGAGFGLYEFGSVKPWENNTVRYNISLDDGIINGGSVGIWKNEERGTMRNCQIYNNTFYNSQEDGNNLWLYDHYPGFLFRNNVFVYNGDLIAEDQEPEEEVFQGNLYWNLGGSSSFFGYPGLEDWAEASGQEIIQGKLVGLYMDPRLIDPESMELTDPGTINAEGLHGFFPEPGSPLIDGGLNLKELFGLDPGAHDIVGRAIPVNLMYDLGAIESGE